MSKVLEGFCPYSLSFDSFSPYAYPLPGHPSNHSHTVSTLYPQQYLIKETHSLKLSFSFPRFRLRAFSQPLPHVFLIFLTLLSPSQNTSSLKSHPKTRKYLKNFPKKRQENILYKEPLKPLKELTLPENTHYQ